jgi:hypothetical protein
MDRNEIIAAFRSRPAEVEAACSGLSDEEMRQPPAEGGWSVLEICCHLRDTASAEGARIRRMIEEDKPELALYDQDAWAIERNYAAQDPKRVFTALRAFWNGLAYLLEGLTDEEWSRPGVHPEAGPTSVEPWAAAEVRHTQEHMEQIRALRQLLTGSRAAD